MCQRTTDEEFDSLWTALEGYDLDQQDQWDVSTGIELVFESLANNPDHFMMTVNPYIHHGTPFGNQFAYITCKLIELLGYDAAREFVGANEFGDKRKWLALVLHGRFQFWKPDVYNKHIIRLFHHLHILRTCYI